MFYTLSYAVTRKWGVLPWVSSGSTLFAYIPEIHVFRQLAIKEVTYSAEVARVCMPLNIICTKANYVDTVEMGGMSHRSWDCTVDLSQMLSVI